MKAYSVFSGALIPLTDLKFCSVCGKKLIQVDFSVGYNTVTGKKNPPRLYLECPTVDKEYSTHDCYLLTEKEL